MRDPWVRFQLSSVEALRLIADFISTYPANRDILNLLMLVTLQDTTGPYRYNQQAQLWFKDQFIPSDEVQTRKTLELFTQFGQGRGLRESRVARLDSKANAIKKDLPRLLLSNLDSPEQLKHLESDRRSDYAALRNDERLLLKTISAHEDGWQIGNMLEGLASPVRVSCAQTQRNSGALFFLYYMKANPSLNAAEHSGQFVECDWLHCYEFDYRSPNGQEGLSGRYTVALSQPIVPLKEGLDQFGRVLLSTSDMFGANRSPSPGVLAVVGRQPPSSDSLIWSYTADLTFHLLPEITAQRWGPDECHVYTLENSSQALAQLNNSIKEQDPSIGYDLRLDYAFYREFSENQRAVLADMEHELRERQAELEALRLTPQPTLLRFTQQQLPSLADVLRGYYPRDLEKIRYAFVSDQTQDATRFPLEGVHFLYLSSPLAEAEMDKLLSWEDHSVTHNRRRFWPEPYWAKNYFSDTSRIQVFVPHGTRLWPSFYSWHKKDMDGYLIGLLKKWIEQYVSPQQIDETRSEWLKKVLTKLPAKTLCIFDGHPNRTDLTLTVLDLNQFVPMKDTNCISWINANIHLVKRAEQLSDDIVRKKLEAQDQMLTAQRITQEVQAQHEILDADFPSLIAHTEAQMQGKFEDFGGRIDKQLSELCTESQEITQKAHQMNREISKMSALHDRLAGDIRLANTAEDQVEKTLEELQKAAYQLEQDVALAIKAMHQEQIDARVETARAENELRDTYKWLLEKLKGTLEKLDESRKDLGL